MADYPGAILITLFVVQLNIFFSWTYFLIYSIKSIWQVPKLQSIGNSCANTISPMVSIILPSRNEERYIEKCLVSLLKQDYPNYEIIAIDDSSTDMTGEIIKRYSKAHSKIIHVDAEAKPKGWTGKNWACYRGYLNAKGSLFLFTDADTTHSSSAISLAVTHLVTDGLDALTAIPKIIACDFWTKITLPMLWTFSMARYSPLKANNPKTKVGYFFGSFFIITRKAYEKVGTHKSVRVEIVEDGELGRKVKEQGFSLRVVHGEKHIDAVWARDSSTLWHGLRRIMIPLFRKEKIKASVMVVATFILVLLPLITIPLSSITALNGKDSDIVILNNYPISLILLIIATLSIILLIATNILQLKYLVFQNLLYSLPFPLAGSFVFIVSLSSIFDNKRENAVNWRGRKYTIR
jgi:chlorobactene glucosyltransferase